MKIHHKSIVKALGIITVAGILIFQTTLPGVAYAAQITNRSLTLQAGATDGGSEPGGVVNHLFSFTLPGGSNVGSIKFSYCTLAAGVCTVPTGLLTTSATLGNESGATGFSMVNTTNGEPYLTRTAAAVANNQAVTYRLDSITNPTTTNQTFFVRIASYVTTDASGGATDSGTVSAATATQIILDGTMPESLVFCAGAAITKTLGVPDCATATPGTISFDQLFSPIDTASAQSQLAASTNAGSGYAITVNGPTLTSGSNTVTAMGSSTTGVKGTSQFGLNLKANSTATTTVARGVEVDPTANGTNYRGQATAGYNTADNFKFTTGDTVADSANGGAGGTDAQIFTVSYIVNVPGSQPAGTYTTTLTYICTPTF